MKKVIILALVFIFALPVSACSSNNPSSASETLVATPTPFETQAGTPTPETTENVNSSETIYPLTIQNYNFAKEQVDITFEKAPEKVLAVYQNSIETLLALGLEDKILACSGLDHEVKPELAEAFSKVNYLTEFAPDKETVVMMEPDFILSWYSFFGERTLGEVDFWHERGANTYMMLNSGAAPLRVLENEYEDILNIGKIFNVQDKAQAIVDEIKDEVSKVLAHSESSQDKKTVLVIEFGRDTIRVYGDTTLGGDMVLKLGADLVTVDGNSIGQEDLIAIDPDVIFVVYMDREGEDVSAESISKVISEPKFASLRAVAGSRVYSIQLGEMYCSGIRTIDGIQKLAQGIYPELYK